MPTWRGKVNSFDTDRVIFETEQFLNQMDERLNDNQVLLVKYHPLMKIDF